MTSHGAVSACLITRNGADTIEKAVASVRPFVDEVVVLDTGSTDRTLELLDRLAGAPGSPLIVERSDWTDFATARDRSFELASSPWAIWLDDDEHVVGGAAIRRALSQLDDATSHVYVRSEVPDRLAERTKLTWRTRSVRRGAGRWDGRVHEVWQPDDEGAFAVVSPRALRVVHAPVDVVGRHDHTAVTLEDAARPDAPVRLLTHAGQELINAERFDEAIELYRRYVERTGGERTGMRLAALERLGTVLAHAGRVEEGLAVMHERERERTEWADAAERGDLRGVAALGPRGFDAIAWDLPPGVGRNDPCPCGSGAKAKRCCLDRVAFTARELLTPNERSVAA